MAFDKGWNFRDSAGFVTDGTNQTYVVGTAGLWEIYPTTRNGTTFGWDNVASGNLRDRNSGNDPRLAGVQWSDVLRVFRIDLPSAADYNIDLALGDPGGGANSINSKVYDNTTLLTTISGSNSSGEFKDANGTNHTSAANWVSNHATLLKTFASTIFKISAEGGLTPVTHVFLSQVATASNPELAPVAQLLASGGFIGRVNV